MITMEPIGVVRSPFTETSQIPKGPGARHEAEGTLEINANLEAGLFDVDLRQMKIHRVHTLTVIDKNSPSSEEEVTHEHDPTVVCRLNRFTSRRLDVHTAVRAPGFPVDPSLQPKGAPPPPLHGKQERAFPEPLRCLGGPEGRYLYPLLLDPFEVLLTQVHL